MPCQCTESTRPGLLTTFRILRWLLRVLLLLLLLCFNFRLGSQHNGMITIECSSSDSEPLDVNCITHRCCVEHNVLRNKVSSPGFRPCCLLTLFVNNSLPLGIAAMSCTVVLYINGTEHILFPPLISYRQSDGIGSKLTEICIKPQPTDLNNGSL